ncbi:MAG: hypothetical protein R3B90_15620 [Planctomycetaceae bacterium]
MLALNCPNCNAPLQVPDDRPQFYCQFCGTNVLVGDAADAVRSGQPLSGAQPDRSAKRLLSIPEKLHVEDFGNELSIAWKWFSPAVFFLIPFAIAWNGFLVGWYAMATGFGGDHMPGPMRIIFLIFPIGHVAVGLGLIYTIVTMLLNKTTVRIRNGELQVSHGPIYYPGGRTIPVDEIEQLDCGEDVRHSRKHGSQVTHRLMVHLKSGRTIKLLAAQSDLAVVTAIEQLVEKHLGIQDRTIVNND